MTHPGCHSSTWTPDPLQARAFPPPCIQVKGPKGAVLNLNYMMQYQLANYHEAEHPDGYHFSAKLNRCVCCIAPAAVCPVHSGVAHATFKRGEGVGWGR